MVLHTAIEYMRNEARALYTIQGPGVTGAGRPWEEAVGTKELATGKSLWRRSLLAFGLASVLFAVVNWSWIDAQVRAVIVLSPVLEAPVLTPVVEALTGEPRFEDASVAGNPALVAKPSGVVTEGRELPEVRRVAEGLARAGYLVVVPDLPGLRRGEIRPQTVHETLEVARAIAGRPDARGGGVGLIGVSTGASLALIAAGDAEMGERISVVAGVAPYTDVRTVLSTATTGHYRAANGEMVPYEADPFLAGAITQSLVSTLPPSRDRDVLLDELERVDRLRPGFLADLREMGAEASSVAELLENRDPYRFDDLYAGLPDEVRAKMEQLSPLADDRRLDVPVELISGPHDKYFPLSESLAVVRIAPHARVTVSGALDHVELSASARDLPDLLLIDAFVVRSLREAR